MPLGIEQFGRAFAHRARRGLYGGRQVLFGNKISEDGGNKYVTTFACHLFGPGPTLIFQNQRLDNHAKFLPFFYCFLSFTDQQESMTSALADLIGKAYIVYLDIAI